MCVVVAICQATTPSPTGAAERQSKLLDETSGKVF
jgi:hypothetical protein